MAKNELLVTSGFANQCVAFLERVDAAIAEIDTAEDAKEFLDKAVAFQAYADRLKAGVEIERPIALGVLKIKAKVGELMPIKSPKEYGEEGGRGNKGGNAALPPFAKPAMSAYRKIAAHRDRLDEYYVVTGEANEVPTQTDFLRFVSGGAHVGNNSGENEWYTPLEFVEAAREVMGGIDLDPASTEAANEIVGAKQIYTERENGLEKEWPGRIWLNPPYSHPLVGQFCEKLTESVESKLATQACVLVNNATETKWFQRLAGASAAICFPAGRVKFWHPDRESAPLQGQAVLYIGRRVASFQNEFTQFGFTVLLNSK